MSNPTFTIYVGPMFSAKTSSMLLALERFKYQNKRVSVFKPMMDDRYSVSEVSTHSGWSRQATCVKNAEDILATLSLGEPPDVIAVDEAFMIPGIADVLIWIYKLGISVVVSSLDLSYMGKPFHEVEKMLPWATTIKKCSAVCTVCGSDAHYTHKKQVTDEDREIEVGGAELYEPRCFSHHLAIDNRPKIHEGE